VIIYEYVEVLNGQEASAETILPTEIQSTKDKLRGLKEMLDEGLITKEEAAAKRAKLLEDY
jgi:hypothetical protein